jgi:hypothetical protein
MLIMALKYCMPESAICTGLPLVTPRPPRPYQIRETDDAIRTSIDQNLKVSLLSS